MLADTAQMEGQHESYTALDRRIGTLFFIWDVFNVFLGAMLGGSTFSQLGRLINDPGSLPMVVGDALPSSSNYFINYIVIQVHESPCSVRLFLPHLSLLFKTWSCLLCAQYCR